MEIKAVLEQRGSRYGSFTDNARLAQSFKLILRHCPEWNSLASEHKEAIEMIMHKLSRIVCGDPTYKDSWVDIAGYATLVADTLRD